MKFKRALSFFAAFSLSASAALNSNAYFKVEKIDADQVTVSWLGHEYSHMKKYQVQLLSYLMRHPSISREVDGQLVARNAYWGDPYNCACWPITVAYKVEKAFTPGRSGQVKVAATGGIPGFEYAFAGGIAVFAPNALGLPPAIEKYCPEYYPWVQRSWI